MSKSGSGSPLSHPVVKSKKVSPVQSQPRPNQQMHVVGSPEGAAAPHLMSEDILRAAQEDFRAIRSVELPIAEANFDDPLVQQELRKRETFERLLSFRKPTIKDITIDGMAYRFKILNPHETSEVIKLFMSLPEDERLNLRERMLLMSAALVSVNGYKLEDIYSGPDVDDVLKKYTQLSEWPNPLVNQLLRDFNDFVAEVKERYLPDFLVQPKAENKDSSGK